MAYEKKEFDFTLFINEATGNRPAVSGTIFVNGQEVPIVGWKRTTKTGKEVYAGCKSVKKEQPKQDDGWETHNAEDVIPF